MSCKDTDFNDLKRDYFEKYSLGFFDKDFSTKVALISLICHLVKKLREKKPSLTYLEVINKLYKKNDGYAKTLAIVCEDMAYGCDQFPTFGIEDKEIPKKIVEILKNRLPF